MQAVLLAPENGRAGGRSSAGQAIIELAFLLPLFVLLFLGVFDFGRVFYHAIALAHAARAGAQYGAQNLGTAADIAGMEQAAKDAAADDLGPITVNPPPRQYFQCGNEGPTPTQVPCSDGNPPKVFVEVTVQETFQTIYNYPGIPHTVNLNRTAVMRAQ